MHKRIPPKANGEGYDPSTLLRTLLTGLGGWGIVAKAPCVSFCETKSHFRGAASDGVPRAGTAQNGMGGVGKLKAL